VLTVRRAKASDVGALAALAREAYEVYVPRIGRPPAPMTADYGEAVSGGLTWIAVRDGVIVGLLVLVVLPDHLLLENVAVLPSAQGSGVGVRLLALAEEQARELGREEIRLYANEAMTENLAYYPKHGYIETHRAEQDGFRRVFFSKRLSDR
jgi:N-acetylglutamate synthase-like GNAT family acetyltransferase